jgi:hypothetical protein
MLKRIFDHKRKEVTGELRKLHNEEHRNFNSLNVIRVMKSRSTRWTEHAAHTEEIGNAYKILARKPERNRPLRIP